MTYTKLVIRIISIWVLLSLFASIALCQAELAGHWTGRIEQGFRVNMTIPNNPTAKVKILVPVLAVKEQANLIDTTGKDQYSIEFKIQGTQAVSLAIEQLDQDHLLAHWIQNNQSEAIHFSRVDSFLPPARTQFPLEPYTYLEEEVTIYNSKDDFSLSGTMTLPDSSKDFPIVILISGSGLQNRDCELLGHKFFLVLADHLTRNGIAVLRYDERGAGQSEGSYHSATTADFKDDVLAVVNKLDSLGYKNVGLIGHSEGGMIAPMVAVEDPRVDFIVSLAGPAITISELMVVQNGNILRDMALPETEVLEYLDFLEQAYEVIDIETPKDSLYEPLKKLCYKFYESRDSTVQKTYGASKLAFYAASAGNYLLPWYRYFVNYDPAENIENLSVPTLALNGKMDIQVAATENIKAYEYHLSKSSVPHYECIALDSINHLFQKVDHWNTSEYYESEETFNKGVMDRVVRWIKGLGK